MSFRQLLCLLPFLALLACNNNEGAAAGAGEMGKTASANTYANLSPSQFAERMAGNDVVVLDVRTPEETARGKIGGARELNYRADDFAANVTQLDTSKTYLVYCASGNRSSKAAGMLIDAGITDVYNLRGGYKAWLRERE